MGRRETLEAVPRLDLAGLPTPLTFLPRFSEHLGLEVWCKRDDWGSPALAGNKVRKLEYLLAEAGRSGADLVVTSGAVQSNSARAAAAACARVGLDVLLVLSGPEAAPSGNLLLDHLVGAEVHLIGAAGWAELEERVTAAGREAEARGRRPFVLPIGCSSPLGVLGFARAYFELADQLEEEGVEAGWIYHASTSGGTHAGLVLGRALAEAGPAVRGISAGVVHPDSVSHHLRLALEAADLLGEQGLPLEVDLDFDHIGRGYAVPTSEASDAIRSLARLEGLLCDPVYSGKGLAGLVADARSGRVEGPVVFWHTGGWQALFDPALAATVL